MAKAPVHFCVDRVVAPHHKAEAAELAIRANPKNEPKLPARLLPGVSANPAKISFFVGKTWPTGKTLTIAFLDGTKIQRKRVAEKAVEWLAYANLKFSFKQAKTAEIRISFNADPGSWSAIGTDCLATQAF